ncbi:uncharacterized protein LOC133175146 isoform X2 [Saccostrea echinata]|uniref:uncharacterized protein LOC133175146 isoform X1 n=1 Tax=Saccostrea echinata TaxID=191078 RepID=UPI002A830392|nr:uncharacterized protein LOC133175146 isoform X1 [Saccostrea echinata]XP_061166259.1 uncharacterized protein LOC133175146 isoform X2 [Saccostrea echinata]
MKVDEIFIVSERSVVIAYKSYTLASNTFSKDIFLRKLKAGEHQTLPYFTEGNKCFHFIRRDRLFFVATTSKETSPILIVEVLTRLYRVFKDFCGVVSEESLQENLLLILEVLNEFLDFGYVQLSTTDKLQPHIQSTPVLTRINRQPTQDITSRVFGIETKTTPTPAINRPVIGPSVQKDKTKNELYVDVIEKITSVVNADGSVSRFEINGAMKVKNFLYGSPQVKVILNNNIIVQRNSRIKAYGDSVQLDTCVFHESAKVDNVDTPSVLTICPQIGEFTLMSYSVSGESCITSPFHFVSSVQPLEHSRDVMVSLRIKNMLPVTSINLRLKFGVPQSVSNISQHLDRSEQTATLEKTDSTILWKIKSLTPNTESVAQFRLISQSSALNREDVGPLRMEFEISGHLLSGMKIKTVKIVNQEQTTPQKWLRYITVSDSFLVKLV